MELMKDFFILKKQREDQIFITNKTYDESFCHVVLNRRFFLSQPKMLPV